MRNFRGLDIVRCPAMIPLLMSAECVWEVVPQKLPCLLLPYPCFKTILFSTHQQLRWHSDTSTLTYGYVRKRGCRGSTISHVPVRNEPMNPYRMAPPPRRWVPKLSPWLVTMTRGHRRKRALKECQLTDIDVQNAEVVRRAVDAGQGVLITPNHPTHADAYTTAAAADACGCPFYYMATWHVFDSKGTFGQWVLQKFGVFSIDREGTDLEAVKIARGILQDKSQPLVIFPEGEVYHCNDRITPFREGAAAIAMFSARKAKRPIVTSQGESFGTQRRGGGAIRYGFIGSFLTGTCEIVEPRQPRFRTYPYVNVLVSLCHRSC